MLRTYKVINEKGEVLRTFQDENKPEAWARFLQYNEFLKVGNKIYGRLSILGKQFYKKKTRGIPEYVNN